jgi:hypothetical protein
VVLTEAGYTYRIEQTVMRFAGERRRGERDEQDEKAGQGKIIDRAPLFDLANETLQRGSKLDVWDMVRLLTPVGSWDDKVTRSLLGLMVAVAVTWGKPRQNTFLGLLGK